jgi:hypothetical protein
MTYFYLKEKPIVQIWVLADNYYRNKMADARFLEELIMTDVVSSRFR